MSKLKDILEGRPVARTKKNMIDANAYDITAAVAKAIDVPRTTLVYAVERDEVEYVQTPSLTVLVSIESAKKWAANRPRPGRKVKQ